MASWMKATAIGITGIASALAVAGLSVLVVQGRHSPNRTAQYVALGSSFASGFGLGPRLQGSPYACLKSSNGYPQQLARMLNLSLADMTCSGATTTHVLHGGQYFQGPQVDALSNNTQLVTLTTGGNDVSYIGDLTFLAARSRRGVTGSLLRLWPKKLAPAENRAFPKLGQELLATLRKIRRRAPHAQIVVVTYPAVLPPSGTCPKLGINDADAALMRQVGNLLAQVTHASAQEAGVSVVDMASLSAGHDACAAMPWVNGAAPAQGARFHPTLAGASATAAAIRKILPIFRRSNHVHTCPPHGGAFAITHVPRLNPSCRAVLNNPGRPAWSIPPPASVSVFKLQFTPFAWRRNRESLLKAQLHAAVHDGCSRPVRPCGRIEIEQPWLT